MIQLKIKVTKEILAKTMYCGETDCKVSTNCAIAVAIRDIFPDAMVEENGIFISPEGYRSRMINNDYDIKLPEKATNFIIEFDAAPPDYRRNMKELEFQINVPDKVIDTINIEEIKPLLDNHPTLEIVTHNPLLH